MARHPLLVPGRAGDFVTLFILGSLLSSLTFGLYYPIFEVRRQPFMTEHSWFGNRRSASTAVGSTCSGPSWSRCCWRCRHSGSCSSGTWHGSAVTSGTIPSRARRAFAAPSPPSACSCSTLGNLLLLVLTLGLAWPWAKVRSVRFALHHLSIEGPLHLDEIQQDARGRLGHRRGAGRDASTLAPASTSASPPGRRKGPHPLRFAALGRTLTLRRADARRLRRAIR